MSDATREAEIAREQRHVDRVYARVDDLRAEAERSQREGHRLARARTPGSLVERDAMVFHAARRMRALDAEYEGLVFGRLDLTDGEVRHIGRLGLRDARLRAAGGRLAGTRRGRRSTRPRPRTRWACCAAG